MLKITSVSKSVISVNISIASDRQELCKSLFFRETTNKHEQCLWTKTCISNLKGTVVNKTLPALHGGPLKNTHTVPLIKILEEKGGQFVEKIFTPSPAELW